MMESRGPALPAGPRRLPFRLFACQAGDDAEALLLIGCCQRRLESHSVSDPAGINSLAGIAETDSVVREATNKVGLQRL